MQGKCRIDLGRRKIWEVQICQDNVMDARIRTA